MSRRNNPFDEIERMLDRMSGQIEQEFGEVRSRGGVAVDVEEHDEEYVVTADLPGFDADDIEVELRDGTLHVEAERESESESEEGQYHRRERRRESASRSVSIPGEVDEDGVSARYRNGVLTVTLPKTTGGGGGHSIEIE